MCLLVLGSVAGRWDRLGMEEAADHNKILGCGRQGDTVAHSSAAELGRQKLDLPLGSTMERERVRSWRQREECCRLDEG